MKLQNTVIGALVVASCSAVYFFLSWNTHRSRMASLPPAPPQTVSASVARYREQSIHLRAVGTLQAVQGVEVSGQVGGLVSSIHFDSGAEVKKGALLVSLVANDDVAKLQALQATAALSKLTYQRDLLQLDVQGVSQQVVDSDREIMRRDEAQVSEQQAQVEYKGIRAPFAGGLGIRRINVGQYVQAGTPLVTLQQLDPIYVDFYTPQQDLGQLKVGQHVTARVDAFRDRVFPGVISAINHRVDVGNRNVQVRATLQNEDHSLVPGMFATVEIDTGVVERRIVVPATAIIYNPSGNTVFLLEPNKDDQGSEHLLARESIVVTGEERGDQVAVLRGLSAGQRVVSSGQSKLTTGAPVIVDNSAAPSDNDEPNPKDE